MHEARFGSLDETRAMPIVKAMKAKAPLSTGIIPVPVSLPNYLFQCCMDWEHDNAVVAATYLAKDLASMVIDSLPELPEFNAMRLHWRNQRACAKDWLKTNEAEHTCFVTVVVPLPKELLVTEWTHWLGVEIGRYAGRCIEATLSNLGVALGYAPEAIANGLIEEWDNAVDEALKNAITPLMKH